MMNIRLILIISIFIGFHNAAQSKDVGEKDQKAVDQSELRNHEEKYQQLHFPPIENQQAGIGFILLKAKSTANVPVSYQVKRGPAYVSGDSLVFREISPDTEFPVEVTVVASQNGKTGELKNAEPIDRTFYIRSGSMKEVNIGSLQELAIYAQMDNQIVNMRPGSYELGDYLSVDSMKARREKGQFQFMTFSGSGNVFNLKGVVIRVDTKLRTALKPPIHTSEFLMTGSGNVINGLEINYRGDGTSPGGAALEVGGSANTVKNITLKVSGSFPYGYGDLFGKGGPDVIRHQKHSGLRVTGSNTSLYGCKLYMRSFGHGFYVQEGAENVHFEDCYVEGKMRKTDDILTETEGPAYEVNFRTWTKNRAGEYRVTPGYMKSLCEDGFRTYGGIKNISFKNCTAKNTRGGFELRTNNGIWLENCTTIGTERAYWVGDGAQVINCKGDAQFGPLIFVEGSNVNLEMYVVPSVSDRKVHALATIQGRNNYVEIKPYKGKNRDTDLPILIGYTHPEHGEAMSPFGEAPAVDLHLRNETTMPVSIGGEVTDAVVYTSGEVIENLGKEVEIMQVD